MLINQLARLPTNSQHMIALSTDKGELYVWDIVNKRPVRTLKGMHLPRKFEVRSLVLGGSLGCVWWVFRWCLVRLSFVIGGSFVCD